MKSLDVRNSVDYNVCFGGINVKRVARTYCDLCGDVITIKIEYMNGRIEKQDLNEFHIGCSE